MITMFKYDSTTIKALFLDIVQFANLEAIQSNKQKWFIGDICVNDSIFSLRTLFEQSGVQMTSPHFAESLAEAFKDAGVDSTTITLNKKGQITFSFKNCTLTIIAACGGLIYFSSAEFKEYLNNPENDYFKDLNIWQLFIETLCLLHYVHVDKDD